MHASAESSRSARTRSPSPTPSRSSHAQSTSPPSISPPRSPSVQSRSPSDASMSARTPSPSRSRRYTSQSPSPPHRPSPAHRGALANNANKTALHVDYLTTNVRESHLRHIFTWYGQVSHVHLTPSPRIGPQRDASAYVVMSSVEQAAKAALYMSGGQIDGAAIAIKTCQPPQLLPPQHSPPPSTTTSHHSRYANRRDTDHHPHRPNYPHRARATDDRDASASHSFWPQRDRDSSAVVHPHPQHMVHAFGRDASNHGMVDRRPTPMRTWGQPHPTRTTEVSESSSMSPTSPHRTTRSSAATRASPSY